MNEFKILNSERTKNSVKHIRCIKVIRVRGRRHRALATNLGYFKALCPFAGFWDVITAFPAIDSMRLFTVNARFPILYSWS